MSNVTQMAPGLARLREPFPDHLVSKLPKPTKQQTEAVKANYTAGIRCKVCGSWHHKDVVHLDYIGHAAITDRLLDADPEWTWEPLATDANGLPLVVDGMMWIKLTVCGVTRIGVGDAQGKTGGDAQKERIGDALRNAAMRFGAALDMWSKVDLHPDEPGGAERATEPARPTLEPYPTDRFAENLPKWRALIAAGEKTADDIIVTVVSRASLSDEQKAAIRGVNAETGEVIDADWVDAYEGGAE